MGKVRLINLSVGTTVGLDETAADLRTDRVGRTLPHLTDCFSYLRSTNLCIVARL
jgi:type IV secretory pathway protease TraF